MSNPSKVRVRVSVRVRVRVRVRMAIWTIWDFYGPQGPSFVDRKGPLDRMGFILDPPDHFLHSDGLCRDLTNTGFL